MTDTLPMSMEGGNALANVIHISVKDLHEAKDEKDFCADHA